MTNIKVVSILVFWLILITAGFAAGLERSDTLFPFPVAESERVIGGWLTDSGYEVLRDDSVSGETRLRARKSDREWNITLKPYSSLMTEVFAKYAVAGMPDPSKLETLRSMLDSYRKGACIEVSEIVSDVPKEVLKHSDEIVCMEFDSEPGHVQLSGFFFNESGFILTTAHDLREQVVLTVTARNGQKFNGRTIKIDPLRDLALVQSHFRPATSISLARGRLDLNLGEKIYSISCPLACPGSIYVGSVNSPPRLANAMPLWQVGLKVLPGSSGSPVFDSVGNLVGIIKGRFRGTDSVGFLIPLSTVMEFLGR